MTRGDAPALGAGRRVLIVGIGTDLRGDDGLGPRVAAALAGDRRARLTVRSVHGLTPELVLDVERVDVVVFVDASADTALRAATWSRIVPVRADDPGARSSHGLDPARLLSLATDLFGRAPEAWLLALPARAFDLGETLSATARASFDTAVGELRGLLGDPERRSRRALGGATSTAVPRARRRHEQQPAAFSIPVDKTRPDE